MTDPRCDCCDLPVYSCGKTKEDRQRLAECRERAALLVRSGWFEARWPGVCVGCGESFKPSTPIRSAHPGGYRAACCREG